MKRLLTILILLLMPVLLLAQASISTKRLTTDTIRLRKLTQLPTHPSDGMKLTYWQNKLVGTDSTAHWRLIDARDTAGMIAAAKFDSVKFVRLGGRSSGQTINGGIAANEDLTLNGTSHATKTSSYVILQPDGGTVTIGPGTGSGLLNLRGASPIIRLSNTAASGTESFIQNLYGTFNYMRFYEGTYGMGLHSNSGLSVGGSFYALQPAAGGMIIQGNTGIKTSVADQPLEINLGTAGAVRYSYNDANGSAATYMDATLSSVGLTTFTGTGSAPAFKFANPLKLVAGTTAIGPLMFTSGALLTSSLAGYMEFLTDKWYGTITTGAARKTFAFLESPVFTGTVETPAIKITTGATSGYYLKSDASGNASWSAIVEAYKGTWNANTNTPTLADGTGTAGDWYWVATGDTINLGSGNIIFVVGDKVLYSGTIWQKLGVPGYTLPTMTASVIGGAKLGLSLATASDVLNIKNSDKGDITTSADTIWTIDNSTVTLAKMANMTTASLIYRKTAGTGAPEVNTLATLRADIGVDAAYDSLALHRDSLDNHFGRLNTLESIVDTIGYLSYEHDPIYANDSLRLLDKTGMSFQTIAGSIGIGTIPLSTSDRDHFLVDSSGIIKYRTGAGVLADIGGQAALSGGEAKYLTEWTSASAIDTSKIYHDGNEFRINTTTDAGTYALQVAGALYAVRSGPTTLTAPVLRLHNSYTTINTDSLFGGVEFYSSDASTGGTGISGYIRNTATNNGVTSALMFGVRGSGDATPEVKLTSAALSPAVTDGNALGTTSLMWSDLFLDSAAVINFDAGDVNLIHSANTLTLGGGNLALGPNNLTMTGSIASTGSRVDKGWFANLAITNVPTIGSNSPLVSDSIVNGVTTRAPSQNAVFDALALKQNTLSGGVAKYIGEWSSASAIDTAFLYHDGNEFRINTVTDAGVYALQVSGNGYFSGNINIATGKAYLYNADTMPISRLDQFTSDLFRQRVTDETGTGLVVLNNTPTLAGQVVLSQGMVPDANDGAYLGQASLGYSGLFLANIAPVSWNAGTVELTGSGNSIILSTGDSLLVTRETYGTTWVNSNDLAAKGDVRVAVEGVRTGTVSNATNIGITNDNTTNAVMYPTWVTDFTGNLPAKVSSGKLSFVPLTGLFTSSMLAADSVLIAEKATYAAWKGSLSAANRGELWTALALKANLSSPVFTGFVTTPLIKITDGSPGAGKVLISDADGDATWSDRLNTLDADTSKFVRLGGRTGGQTIAQLVTITDSLKVANVAFTTSTWNNSLRVPTSNAVRDELVLKAPLASPTFTGTVTGGDSVKVVDLAYNATTWNNSLGAPTKNSIRDKIEAIGTNYTTDTAKFVRLGGRTGGQTIAQKVTFSFDSTLVYNSAFNSTTWNNSTAVATKNAIRDEMILKATINKPTFTDSAMTVNRAYSATTWNNANRVPTENAIRDQLVLLAPIASPTFTGTVNTGDSLLVALRAYSATTWNNSKRASSEDAVRDLYVGLSSVYAPIAGTTYVGTTAIALNRASAAQVLTGITSIDGTAANATNIGITNDVSTDATMYPLWVTGITGNLPAKVSSTKTSFNPAFGSLKASSYRQGQLLDITNVVVCDGDSRTYGFTTTGGEVYPYSDTLELGANYQVYNTGIVYATLTDQASGAWLVDTAYTRVDQYYSNVATNNIVVIWAGRNDIEAFTQGASAVYNSLMSYCKDRKQKGWRVIVCTEIDLIDHDAERVILNQYIRQQWYEFADGLCDLAAIDSLSDHTNVNYFVQSELPGVHLTEKGYATVGGWVAKSITELVGQWGRRIGPLQLSGNSNSGDAYITNNLFYDGVDWRLRRDGAGVLQGSMDSLWWVSTAALGDSAATPTDFGYRLFINGNNIGIDGVTSPITSMEFPNKTTNSNLKIGSLEFQGYASNNSHITSNIFFNGTNYKYRANGYGLMTGYYNNMFFVSTAPSGLAGENATLSYVVQIDTSGVNLLSGNYMINGAVLGTTVIHYIGESYGGGIVFYVYDNGHHGLIAAAADQGTYGILWSGGGFRLETYAIASGLGAGIRNTTLAIILQHSQAALAANNYSASDGTTTFSDWYLPSYYELNLLYLQKAVVGGFSTTGYTYYWSSSEGDIDYAWAQAFSDGTQSLIIKDATLERVRAIRSF
jgi:hypothetical protein